METVQLESADHSYVKIKPYLSHFKICPKKKSHTIACRIFPKRVKKKKVPNWLETVKVESADHSYGKTKPYLSHLNICTKKKPFII